MSEYDVVVSGSLKLKNGQGITKKKKRSHKKSVQKSFEENLPKQDFNEEQEETVKSSTTKRLPSNLTKSQIEWEKRRDRSMIESVLSKADKSHKQRIIEFNNYLSTLTEHFDIQKVSWTK